MIKHNRKAFTIKRLNALRDESWAVINILTGAIALDGAGNLLMRLSQEDAAHLAAVLTKGDLSPSAVLEDFLSVPEVAG